MASTRRSDFRPSRSSPILIHSFTTCDSVTSSPFPSSLGTIFTYSMAVGPRWDWSALQDCEKLLKGTSAQCCIEPLAEQSSIELIVNHAFDLFRETVWESYGDGAKE